jgi:hypothetical protein
MALSMNRVKRYGGRPSRLTACHQIIGKLRNPDLGVVFHSPNLSGLVRRQLFVNTSHEARTGLPEIEGALRNDEG